MEPGSGIPCECPHCRGGFEAARSLAGGITNCPRCGKAVEVAGLRDPLWRLLQLGAIGGVGLATWLAAQILGPGAAVVTAVVGCAGAWLLSRVL